MSATTYSPTHFRADRGSRRAPTLRAVGWRSIGPARRSRMNGDANGLEVRARRACWRLGMGILAVTADERVADVFFDEETLSVRLKDGRTISVPLAWYPKLFNATTGQRHNWKIAGGGYGIHWPQIDEDISTEGLLRGAPAPRTERTKEIWNKRRKSPIRKRTTKLPLSR